MISFSVVFVYIGNCLSGVINKSEYKYGIPHKQYSLYIV